METTAFPLKSLDISRLIAANDSFEQYGEQDPHILSIREVDLANIEIRPLFAGTDKKELFLRSEESQDYLALDARFLQFFLENPALIPDAWRTLLGNADEPTCIFFDGTRFRKYFCLPQHGYKRAYQRPCPFSLWLEDRVWRCGFGDVGLDAGDCFVAVIRKPKS